MSDRFFTTDFAELADWVFTDLEQRGSVFDIFRDRWFEPRADDGFRLDLGDETIATPFGVAAGPHTQLAAGIVASWLCGARLLELKTVQRRGVEVVRPCIRMRDEGLNVEWSQELEPEQSFAQYLDAWVLVHALHRRLGWPGSGPETVFDISVGYDFDGLVSAPMERYFALVADAGEALLERQRFLGRLRRDLADLEVPSRLARRVTLSTLHGCPAEDIGRMMGHLMTEHGLHARVKLNPSLLGAEFVRSILHDELGFTDFEPDEGSFAQDLRLADAVDLVAELRGVAARAGVTFGVKLSNTLALRHRGEAFPVSENTMYLSGRPLHPLTVQTAAALARECGPELSISFCGGADALNAPSLLACGLTPVTTCSDLLRPGGIPRLRQYVDTTRAAMDGAQTIDDYCLVRARQSAFAGEDSSEAAAYNLQQYAKRVLFDPAYQRATFHRPGKRSTRGLGLFDCIHAPCIDACGIEQDVPEYLRRVAAGDTDGAVAVIRRDNPLPVILGRTCHHPCETDCVRTHYDEPVAIRDIKRFAMEYGSGREDRAKHGGGGTVAVVGGGPCGLAAAWELRRAGIDVTVFEADAEAGGMVTATIPVYRASDEAVQTDLVALEAAGVDFRYGQRCGLDFSVSDLRAQGFDAIVLAAGAPCGKKLGLAHEEAEGVWDGLRFLRRTRRGGDVAIGRRVGVIGAGDVAMDCARTAIRLGAEVSVIYRRQAAHSPAHPEEMRALVEEDVVFCELLNPVAIKSEGGVLRGVRCQRMRPGAPGADGRPRPEPVPGEFEVLELDTLVVAIGQNPDPATLEVDGLELDRGGRVVVDPDTGKTSVERLWAGGDVVRGPSSIVAAAGDGRRIARDVVQQMSHRQVSEFGAGEKPHSEWLPDKSVVARLMALRAERVKRVPTPELAPADRRGFGEVAGTYSVAEARAEAARCLECDVMCSTCVTVCPNRAFLTYSVEPFSVCWPEGDEMVEHEVAQPYQVAVINDWCNACGNCTEFCPTAGEPHVDKPRIVFDRQAFELIKDNAFHPLWRDGVFELLARHDGATHRLTWGDVLRYEHPLGAAEFDPDTAKMTGLTGVAADWSVCVVMLALGRGLQRSAPGLLAACARRANAEAGE